MTRHQPIVEMRHGHHDDGDVQHEQSDVNIRAIFAFGAGLAVLGVVVALVVALLFGYLTRLRTSVGGTPLSAGGRTGGTRPA